jgi:hypothetical protein
MVLEEAGYSPWENQSPILHASWHVIMGEDIQRKKGTYNFCVD